MSFVNVSSFQKKRLDQIVLVDPAVVACAVFAFPKQNWYRDTFKSSVACAFAAVFPRAEASNLPFWWSKTGVAQTMTMWRVSGHRTLVPLNAAFVSANWDSTPEIVGSGIKWPIRGITSGTYVLYFDIGGTFNVDISANITNGEGNLIDIVRQLNANVTFNAVAEAYCAGFGPAAQLGIRCLTDGILADVEIVTGGANDCSAALGFSLAKENLYDIGDAAESLGTFTQMVQTKAS